MRLRSRFDAAVYETVQITPLSPGRVRLDEAPVLAPVPVCARDVVEVETLSDGTHQFVRAAEPMPARP